MNLFIYYLKVLLPLPLIFICLEADTVWLGLGLLLFYSLLYKPFIDAKRLENKGIIKRGDYRKIFFYIGGFQIKYFKELYFEK